MEFIKDYKVRRWLYGVVAAGFAVAAGYGLVTNEQTDSWLLLAEALLDLVPTAALTLAAVKAAPAVGDVKDNYTADQTI